MEKFDVVNVLFYLSVILFSTKILGMLMRRLGLPQVVGMVLAGILIGPALWGCFGWWSPINPDSNENVFLKGLSEVGVVMILFSAGLETDVKELKRSGFASTTIALMGVIVPIILGFLVAVLFMGGFANINKEHFFNALFVGIILAATSVGITVETLKEMGKLSGKVGTTIVSAAIIDDVIGIIVLSIVSSMKDPASSVWKTIGMTLLFFVCAIAVGLAVSKLFKILDKNFPHRRRVPIFALAVCFFYAFAAEKWFGIADITGAYIAGILLSTLKDTNYIDTKLNTNSYMLFSPVFFAYIGINTSFAGINGQVLLFAFTFAVVGIIGKIIGCGGIARCFKYTKKESAIIGCGMIPRGEVALAVYSKGVDIGLIASTGGIDPKIAVITLIILSSLLCPALLKSLFGKGDGKPDQECSSSVNFSEEDVELSSGSNSTNGKTSEEIK